MIIFSWTLTPNQVACLKSIADHHRADDKAMAEKRAEDNPLGPPGFGNFIAATRLLFREGLCITKEVPVELWQRGKWTGPTRPKWEITEKGLLMLKLVQLEVRDQANLLVGNMMSLKAISDDANPTRGTLLSGKKAKQ